MATPTPGIGARLAPPRFIAFAVLLAIGVPLGIHLLDPARGAMAGFDVAAFAFLASCVPLLDDPPARMRETTRANDANRAALLALTVVVLLAILVAVGAELARKGALAGSSVALIVATLALAWSFTNAVYALHYAHMYYATDDAGGDARGLAVPGSDEPVYWDFLYFAVTLGMTFQTADVAMTDTRFRRVALAHGVAAFVFNLGVVAFTINVLGN